MWKSPRRDLSVGLLLLVLAGAWGCGERSTGPEVSDSNGTDPIEPRDRRTHAIAGSRVSPDEPFGGPSVSQQLVVELAPGWTAVQINEVWGTTTVEHLAGTPFVLIAVPESNNCQTVAGELLNWGACRSCGPNYYLQAPEAEQASLPFYEGDLVGMDIVDQYALGLLNAGPAHLLTRGAGVTVAILDTGVDFAHPDLVTMLSYDGWDFVGRDGDPQDETDGIDQDGDGLVDEAAGHGTHVAGIVHATAPDATLLPIRVLDSEGRGTAFDVACGIRHAVESGADVINMSLGFDGTSRIVEKTIADAYHLGVFLVASHGNQGTMTDEHFPASLPQVIAVAATDAVDLKPAFSNYGRVVSVSAPGDAIVSTYLYQGYAVWSGTSMAAPFVAGAGALAIDAHPSLSPLELQGAIEGSSAPLDHSGQPYDGMMGAGRIDLLSLVAPSNPY